MCCLKSNLSFGNELFKYTYKEGRFNFHFFIIFLEGIEFDFTTGNKGTYHMNIIEVKKRKAASQGLFL